MKRIFLMTFIFVSSISFSFGQLIQEGQKSMSQGVNNSFSMELREANKKDVEKLWTKYAKNFKGKTKKDKKSGEFITDNGTVNAISNNTVDIYTSIQQSGDNSLITLWFDLGGAFLSSGQHPDKAIAAENLIMDFALTVTASMLEEMLKVEEKSLKKLEGDLSKLKKDKENYEKDILNAEKLIEERKADIQKNIVDQENKTNDISTQKERVINVQAKIDKIN